MQVTVLLSLLHVILIFRSMSHTNNPLSFSSPKLIKYFEFGENSKASIESLCPLRVVMTLYCPSSSFVYQIVISGYFVVPSPAAINFPSALYATHLKCLFLSLTRNETCLFLVGLYTQRIDPTG